MSRTARQREREIQECLLAHGVSAGPRRLLRRPTGGELDHGRRLGAALLRLGPLFAAFGLYVSSRADLLPLPDCLALAAALDAPPAIPGTIVWQTIARETSTDPARLFAGFEAVPRRSHALWQVHHAHLRTGEPVAVWVHKEQAEGDFARDAAFLPALQGAIGCNGEDGFDLEGVVADFRRYWEGQADFLEAVERMGEYARAQSPAPLRTPVVHRHLCTPRLLVLERLPGVGLADMRSSSRPGGAEEQWAVSAADVQHLTGRLWRAWLEQALEGPLFPVVARASEIVVLRDRRLAFAGLGLAGLPGEAQRNLREYLAAACRQDLDRACGFLLLETEPGPQAGAEDELRGRLRQLAPFRDGGWGASGERDTVAEHLALHLRLAREHGYRLRRRSIDFFRSFFVVSAAVRSVAPAQDSLRAALEDLRLRSAVSDLRTLFGPGAMRESMDRFASLALELPSRLDDALTLTAAPRPASHPRRLAPVRRPGRAPALAAALLSLFVGAALGSRQLGKTALGQAWAERLGAVAVAGAGLLLLSAVAGRAR